MSWRVINQILGLAAVDQEFAQELLKEPLTAIWAQGFQLTPEEQKVFSEVSANTLRELSQHLLQELNHSQSQRE